MRVQKYAFNISNISCCSLPVFCRLCKWFKIKCQNQTTWCVTVLSLTKKNQRQIDHSPIKSRVCLVPHLICWHIPHAKNGYIGLCVRHILFQRTFCKYNQISMISPKKNMYFVISFEHIFYMIFFHLFDLNITIKF